LAFFSRIVLVVPSTFVKRRICARRSSALAQNHALTETSTQCERAHMEFSAAHYSSSRAFFFAAFAQRINRRRERETEMEKLK
jgi:hypothetical protein